MTCSNVLLSGGQDNFDDSLFEKAIRAIYSIEGYSPEMLSSVDEFISLNVEIYKRLSSGLTQIEAGVLPGVMREALDRDIFHFSGLKSNAALYNASRMLLDENGLVKPFNSFLKDVQTLKKDYLESYLESEYEFAVASAQMAANWSETDPDNEYDLQYRTAADDRVRDSHKELHNITLPKEDPFWDNYYPPNGWRCRCIAIEVIKDQEQTSDSAKAAELGESATTQISKAGTNKLEIFRFNPGKQELIFPPRHPYRKVLGADQVKSAIEQSLKSSSKLLFEKANGSLSVHRLVSEDDADYQRLLQVGKIIARTGRQVTMLPGLSVNKKHGEYSKIYGGLSRTKYNGKCPDFLIDGEYYEEKGFISTDPKKAASNMLSRAVKQSDRIIIQDTGITDGYLSNILRRRIAAGQEIKSLWVIKDGKLIEFY